MIIDYKRNKEDVLGVIVFAPQIIYTRLMDQKTQISLLICLHVFFKVLYYTICHLSSVTCHSSSANCEFVCWSDCVSPCCTVHLILNCTFHNDIIGSCVILLEAYKRWFFECLWVNKVCDCVISLKKLL